MKSSWKSFILFLSILLFFPLVAFTGEPTLDCPSNDQACLNYQKALDNYQKLKYLEEKQLWDDYFANGNTYREQIVENAKKVIDQVDNTNPLRAKSRLLLWQFHRDQQDALAGAALDDLMVDLRAYAQAVNDSALLKSSADKLMTYEEKSAAREIYKLYMNKLISGQMSQVELKNVAAGFYKEGNLELAQTVFDRYIEEISKTQEPDKLIRELFEIASLFVYKPIGLYDLAYAEKIYVKIEGLNQKEAFNQETIYLRAFNLEKFTEFKGAAKLYLQLTQSYPDSKYFDEAIYKIAMINAYVFADNNEARKYFEVLTSKTVFSPQVISAFYQLGLLSQWEGNFVKAKDYYESLLKNAQDKYVSSVAQTKERLKEIQENSQLSYNLKIVLDLSLKSEAALLETNKTQLSASSYILEKNQNNTISSLVNMPQSGCNQVELQYLWSGDLGGANPVVSQSNFQNAYADSGTKAINLVIISPAGTLDRSFMMLDVY